MTRFIPATITLLFFLSNMALCQKNEELQHNYKLPKFKTDSPQFCLLNFPAENSSLRTVLIVTDGSTLYFDRNANRNLTDTGESVESTSNRWQSDRDFLFKIDEINFGTINHRSIQLSVSPLENYVRDDKRIDEILHRNPKANSFMLSAQIQDDRSQGKEPNGRVKVLVGHSDIDGVLQFGNTVATAPTINLCGDLEIRPYSEMKLRPESTTDIVTVVELGDYSSVRPGKVSPDKNWVAFICQTRSKALESRNHDAIDWDLVNQNELKIISQDGTLLETMVLPVGTTTMTFSPTGDSAVIGALGSVYKVEFSQPFKQAQE